MSTPASSLRADASRNRELLLAAAEAEFAERGAAASVADIARRAGVAKGTVFRHFATKEELIVAVVVERTSTLVEAARDRLDAPDPGAALFAFLTVAADERQRHDLTYLQTASEGDERVAKVRDEVLEGVTALVDRAREAGALRQDVTGTDVFLLMCAPVHVVENLRDPAPGLWRRYLSIIFDGLRPEGASPLGEPPPEIDQGA